MHTHDVFDVLLTKIFSEFGKRLFYFICRNFIVVVKIHLIHQVIDFLIREQILPIDSCRHEFLVVNIAIVIRIELIDHGLSLLIC